MSTKYRPGNRETRRAEDKALLCLKRRTKIRAKVHGKISKRRLEVAAAARGLRVTEIGIPVPLAPEACAKILEQAKAFAPA